MSEHGKIIEKDGRRFMKIWLPGESPWAEVIHDLGDDRYVARIDNKVAGDYSATEFSEMLAAVFGNGSKPSPRDERKHRWRFNDLLVVERDKSFKDGVLFVPAADPLQRH